MIIATAGHVDHGKTSLVKSITGVDTDKLPEEKSRGLTIELGFAYHDIGDGVATGFIDVPGHEKFIRTMIAGVNGIDCVLFIIAVDDGPMPQTIEHLAIMDLLGIEHGVFALTKIDRASEQRIEEVKDEVASLIKGTSLANAEIIPVSAHTGENIPQLSAKLLELSASIPPRDSAGKFRMAIDRNFILQGTGRVVAGTILAGKINQDDRIRLLPQDVELRVRGIHAQNAQAETAHTGERTALNISGGDLKRLDIRRGNWVVDDNARLSTTKIDTQINVLNTESRPLRNRTPVHLHIGAADIGARIITLDSSEIAPGENGLVQLQLNQACNAVFGDRFILRDQSALRTIGGGTVIDASPITRGRSKELRLAVVEAQRDADPQVALTRLLDLALDDFDLSAYLATRNLDATTTEQCLSDPSIVVLTHTHGKTAFTRTKWQDLQTYLEKACANFHRKFPDKIGPNDGHLVRALPKKLGKHTAAALIEASLKDKLLVRDGGQYRLPKHTVKRAPENEALWNKVSAKLTSSGRKAPVVHDLHTELQVDLKQLNQFLIGAAKQGFVIKVSDKRYFMPATIREFATMAESLANEANGAGFTVKQYRDVSGIGRNAVIEILEYFDRIGLTFRQDQIRKIRKTAAELYGD